MRTENVLCLEPGSPSWPAELSEIEGPPAALWVRGELAWLEPGLRIAIVGSRAPSAYGEAQAARFAASFARAGAVVVSGLARGIDAAAHEAALAAGGGTIAVLGGGVDRPWPPGELALRVAREGLFVAEFAPGTPPRRHHFPRRNRLISGLARAVLVVEAAYASGSLITARWAADQGRLVCALPGRVDHPMSRGAHRLLREGALLVEEPEELLAELGAGAGAAPAGPAGAGWEALHADAADTPGALLAALVGETSTADELALRTGRDVGDVLTALVLLELGGRVARGPGGLYRLAQAASGPRRTRTRR